MYKKYIYDIYYIRFGDNKLVLKHQIFEDFTNSIVLFNGLYYIFKDSLSFDRYDANLVFIDNYKINENNCSLCTIKKSFLTTKDYLFFQKDSLFIKTKDLVNLEDTKFSSVRIDNGITFNVPKKSLKDNIYFINKENNQYKLIKYNPLKNRTDTIINFKNNDLFGLRSYTIFYSDLTILDNKIYFINNLLNTILFYDLEKGINQEPELVTDLELGQNRSNFIFFNDSTFVTQSIINGYPSQNNISKFPSLKYVQSYSNTFFITNNKGNTFRQLINKDTTTNYFYSYNKFVKNDNTIIQQYYDDRKHKIYFFHNESLLDTFKNFKSIENQVTILPIYSRMIIDSKSELLILSLDYLDDDNYKTRFEIYDKNLKYKNFKNFENQFLSNIFHYPYLVGNENILISNNIKEFKKSIVKSNFSLDTLITLKSFENVNINYGDTYEFKANNEDYLIFCNYYLDGKADINLFNVKTEKHSIIKTFEYKDFNLINTKTHFTFDKDTLFVAINDSIFYLDYQNQLDTLGLYCKLPDNGRFVYQFQKFNNAFFGAYEDTLQPRNTYRIEYYKKEVEDPKPIIQADDYDFGEFDIKSTNFKTQTLKLKNTSTEADLVITDIQFNESEEFETNILELLQPLPYNLNKGEELEYTVTFKPKTIGEKIFEIEYVSNATENDNIAKLTGKAIDTLISSVEYDIEENQIIYNSLVYPNPSSGDVSVEIAYLPDFNIDNANYEIYNVLGSKINIIKDVSISNLDNYLSKITWSSIGLNKGIYFLNISDGQSSINIKFIID